MLSARTINLDGRRSSWVRKLTMYTLATAGAKIARNAGKSKRGGSNKVIMSGVNGNVIMSGCGMTTLTMKDEKRLEIIQRVLRGELTLAEAGLESQSGSVTGSKRG